MLQIANLKSDHFSKKFLNNFEHLQFELFSLSSFYLFVVSLVRLFVCSFVSVVSLLFCLIVIVASSMFPLLVCSFVSFLIMQLWPPISWKVRFLSEEKCVYFFGSQYVIAIVQILKTLLKRLKKLFFSFRRQS